nr:putative retrotransposon protein [Tanacetum cinerariifolium]
MSRQGVSYFITFMDGYSRYGYVYLLKHKHEVFETFKVFKNEVENQLGKTIIALRLDQGGLGCEALVKRDTLDKLQQRSVKRIFVGYPKETMSYYFYFPPKNKIVVARYAEFFEKNLISQEVSGREGEHKEIQGEDTSPSENTSEIPAEVEGFKPPQEEEAYVRRAIRILIAIVAFYDYEIWQMYVKTSFLNGYLDEYIYMVQPEGFVDPKHPKNNPGKPHWTAKKTILKYLIITKDMFLVYGENPKAELRVYCYCDVGFETDRDDIKYHIRYVFILNEGIVDRKSSKKSTTAMSTIEAEYLAALEAAMKAVWIRKFILRLGIVPTINEPIKLLCDNSAELLIANEPGVQRDTRHYHRR